MTSANFTKFICAMVLGLLTLTACGNNPEIDLPDTAPAVADAATPDTADAATCTVSGECPAVNAKACSDTYVCCPPATADGKPTWKKGSCVDPSDAGDGGKCVFGGDCTESCDGLQCKCGKLMPPSVADKVVCSTPDAGTPDSGPSDTGSPPADSGSVDTGSPDTGTLDTGTPDTGVTDTGSPDTGPMDTGTPDTGTVADTSVSDTAPPTGLTVTWTPPTTYADGTLYVQTGVVDVLTWYGSGSYAAPVCVKTGISYVCTLPVMAPGTPVTFTVRRDDPRAGSEKKGYSFDKSCYPAGGCTKEFGTTVVMSDGVVIPITLVWNGFAPAPPYEVFFNGTFVKK